MDPQHRITTVSGPPGADIFSRGAGAPPGAGARFGSPSARIGRWRWPAGFAGNSQYDRFLLLDTSRDPGADAGESVKVGVRLMRPEWRSRWQWSPGMVTDRLPEQPIGDASAQIVNRHLVAAALGRLTQEHRDVLRECYFLGSSVAQAAHALGIAPGTVKSRTYYALRALRLAIEELRDVE
jgi:RNA polymerase sigma-70 factor (ECF subfamily)